ncbi:hypothetical protein GCM10009415_50170 [Chitinophaga japonensis]
MPAITSLQLQDPSPDNTGEPAQRGHLPTPFQFKRNDTGLPDHLKTGVEQLSGLAMDDVKVHYNDSRPAQMKALAYARGTDIYVGPGQERHLPHEAWHVVQQKQQRVAPAIQYKGNAANNDPGLEREADNMGARAAAFQPGMTARATVAQRLPAGQGVIQRLTGYEIETQIPVYGPHNEVAPGMLTPDGENGFTAEIGQFLIGGLKYGLDYGNDPEGRFHISADHNDLSSLHLRIVDKLILLGLVSENWQRRGMANIEYITPPRNELAPASQHEHAADIAAVKAHLNTTLGIAHSDGVSPVPPPGHNIMSGIPVTALNKWLGVHGIPEHLLAGELDAFSAAISNDVYIQETSGVLPEDVPLVYEEATKKIQSTTTPGPLAQIMAGMMFRSIEIAQEAFDRTLPKPPEWIAHQKAITGFLTLLSSYVLADELSFLKIFSGASSVAKNLVPFMSKTKLHEAIKALPAAVLPAANKDTWEKCATELQKSAQPYKRDYWSGTYAQPLDDELDSGMVFPNGAQDEITKLLDDNEMEMYAITGRPLGLDEPHPDVKAVTGQQAIPLEDRYFKQQFDEKLTAENMESKIAGRFAFATDLQLSHLPEAEDKRKHAALSVNTPLGMKGQIDALAVLIREKIARIQKLSGELIALNLIPDPIATGAWAAKIETILKDVPQEGQQAALAVVNNEVGEAMAMLQDVYNKEVNKDKSNDGNLTQKGAAERFFKNNADIRFGGPLVEFRKKNIKASDLKEKTDQEKLRKILDQVESARQLYQKKKAVMLEMPVNISIGERLKNFEFIQRVTDIFIKKLAEAEAVYNACEKKVGETKELVI